MRTLAGCRVGWDVMSCGGQSFQIERQSIIGPLPIRNRIACYSYFDIRMVISFLLNEAIDGQEMS
jgi:hypothetical protein